MSPVWLDPFEEKAFRVRLVHGRRRGAAGMFRPAPFLRPVRHRKAPFTLNSKAVAAARRPFRQASTDQAKRTRS